MRGGAENRKKTVLLGVLGSAAISGLLYNVFGLFGGSSTPPPSVAPVSSAAAPPRAVNSTSSYASSTSAASSGSRRNGDGGVPGVAAQKLASTSASLDPTLDEAAMLRTENLVYTGSGRNIFSATYTPAAMTSLPKNVPPPRPTSIRPVGPPVPTEPPPAPAIPLKYFGTAQSARGPKRVFLLSGEDVYLASAGDIVAKRFKVDQILGNGVQVTDLLTDNTQTLPMQQ